MTEHCTDCKEYDQEKHCCHRFGRVIRQTQEEYLEQIPRWIPCSERLPETTDEVLVTYIVNGNKKRRFVQTSTYYDNEEEGYWSSPWDEYLVPNTKIEELAWMPLPKPYEVEE